MERSRRAVWSSRRKNVDFNIFENIDNSDTYVTYYVYMVKEEDTLDKILLKYQVTKEEVELYNDINRYMDETGDRSCGINESSAWGFGKWCYGNYNSIYSIGLW